MKKVSILSLAITCLIVAFFSFMIGYFVIDVQKNEKPPNEIIGSEEKDNEIEINAKDDVYIGPNTDIEYITHYLKCNHYKSEVKNPDIKMINMDEEEFKNYIHSINQEWKVALFSHDRVVIKIEKEHLCPNHYIIGVKDEKIAIFKINKNGERKPYKIINVSITTLKKIDQEKLKKGIIVDSEDKITDVLENFIS
ncbi:BofC C-terminal domain-containing protein [Caldisalinibacter kiritimatiensis]|uniref:Bypass of forespore C C-terminal domain-containing protein n=1 Tax=Caldisalinibacter kiritimatiensis TaxID=1304284 RepID=R1AVJ1_9FIRM|nr:BofC C-terminal domain-containing protein [Caldisalinibacter kiritimatiensis]EOD00677.1 hypothetical protein L21TH_1278 [Caldisalinibacter kiritimatiensis]